jgi:O-antigen ligase
VALFPGLATTYPLGVGVGTVGPAAGFGGTNVGSVSYNSEDEWNYLVVETGLLGVVIYVAFIFRLMWLALTRIRHVPDATGRLYLAALAAPIFAILVADFSGPTSAALPAAPFLWLVAGILAYRLVTAYRVGPPDDPIRAVREATSTTRGKHAHSTDYPVNPATPHEGAPNVTN